MREQMVQYSRQFPSAPSSVGQARRFLVWALDRTGSSADASVPTLVLSELATNAVEYGGGPSIRTTIKVSESRIVVEVEDDNPAEPQTRADDPGCEETAGRGLRIVDHLANRWGWTSEDESKTVWAEFDILGARFAPNGVDPVPVSGDGAAHSTGRGPPH